MQCHYGTNDHNTTEAEIHMFRETLEACGKKFEIHMYEGASHGFLNSGGKKSEVDRLASDRALAKSCTWLKRALS
jgi:dienelactone hydrolase